MRYPVQKTEDELLKDISGMSFSEEILKDIETTITFLNRYDELNNQKSLSIEKLNQERKAHEVFKKALLLTGASGLQITSKEGETISAAENQLPISSYLAHGARIKIEIPAGSGDSLVKWLIGGELPEEYRGLGSEVGGVYHRHGATDSIGLVKDEDGNLSTTELKGFLYGLGSAAGAIILGRPSKHYGIDLAIGVNEDGFDEFGKKVESIDGDHGHLYIYYKPATAIEPGAIMLGVEGSAPISTKHSKLGSSDPMSPFGTSLWEILEAKKISAILPQKYNGMNAKVSQDFIDTIIQIDNLEEFNNEFLAKAFPGEDLETFLEGTSNNSVDFEKLYDDEVRAVFLSDVGIPEDYSVAGGSDGGAPHLFGRSKESPSSLFGGSDGGASHLFDCSEGLLRFEDFETIEDTHEPELLGLGN